MSENISFLKKHYPYIHDILSKQNFNTTIAQLVETKAGCSTIQVQADGLTQLIHSKYDPLKEAARFIDQFADEIGEYEHVLFYGIGLGYHVEEFMKRYPEYWFSLYEPSVDIFNLFLKERDFTKFPTHRLKEIVVEESREQGKHFLGRLTHEIQERVLVIVLPSYKQIFKEQYLHFTEDFKEAVGQKRQDNFINHLFSARWTLNSLINLPKTIQTPNILSDEFKQHFKDKPLIIVSAGPSLEEEYENLRFIKEKKLAYIFAVGSANRALIANNIEPDAVCTYDPQGHNHQVFSSMIEQGITNVPLIFGTSVGFETLNWYQGPKLHMVTSQDSVAQFYLRNKDNSLIEVINDSPTIAAVTFQLAAKLGCNPIMFAGQNLGFRNNLFYAKEVEYKQKNRPVEIIEEDRAKVLLVEDVYGYKIETTPSFNSMREFIEYQIDRYPNIEVINTTKGGATIKGTVFQPIEELIEHRLTKSEVDENWYTSKVNQYEATYALDKIRKMERSIENFRKLYLEIQVVLEEINKNILNKKENKLEKLTLKFDKLMKKLIDNESYLAFIQPVNRSHFQALSLRVSNVRKQTNEIERAKLLIEAFVPFLEQCNQTLEQIVGSIYKVHYEVSRTLSGQSYKFYPSDCGVFHYIGDLETINQSANKTIDYHVKQMVTNKATIIRFKFSGTMLRILGSKNKEGSSDILVKIDDQSCKISTRQNSINKTDNFNIKEVLFERHNLEDREHFVEISVLDNNYFLFTGVEINVEGRLTHIQEVINVEELEIGKRIRCHYKATYNTVGEFEGIGKVGSSFLPVEAQQHPIGDFYFIMVDEVDGEKILIADRNIQNYISWLTLKEFGFCDNPGKVIGSLSNEKYKVEMKLLTGGDSEIDIDNEWNRYIVQSNLGGGIEAGSDQIWKWSGQAGSWTITEKDFRNSNKDTMMPIRSKVFVNQWYGEDSSRWVLGTATNVNSYSGFRPKIHIKNQ